MTSGPFFLDIQNMLAIVSPSSLWNVERAVGLNSTNSLEGEAIAHAKDGHQWESSLVAFWLPPK